MYTGYIFIEEDFPVTVVGTTVTEHTSVKHNYKRTSTSYRVTPIRQ